MVPHMCADLNSASMAKARSLQTGPFRGQVEKPTAHSTFGSMSAIFRWLRRLRARLQSPRREIPQALWDANLARYPFLAQLSLQEQAVLRHLSTHFLGEKQFSGAQGQTVSNEAALAVASQACLPLLHWSLKEHAPRRPRTLDWYDDFVGIVLYPGPVLAHREASDGDGVVHRYAESLAGEAMVGGPVVLSWPDVAAAATEHVAGHNLVIHEFAHKLDMHDGTADGCPPLPKGFMQARGPRGARRIWRTQWQDEWQRFCDAWSLAARFGAAPPWLDRYGTTSMTEFFAVCCEAYFVNRERFSADFPTLLNLLDAFFRPQQKMAESD